MNNSRGFFPFIEKQREVNSQIGIADNVDMLVSMET